jgi:type I restriction enzyme, R subunit
MRRALPNASYIAFTGTPLLKAEKTASKFGPIVHAYTTQRAVEDGNVAPLLYEQRVPELDINQQAVNRWFDKITAGLTEKQASDLKRKYANRQAIYGAANRIELIAWDIATHFDRNLKQLDTGLKGQLATSSKLDAIRYKQALDETQLVTSAVIISPPDTREGNSEVDEDTLPEVQKWWKKNITDKKLDPAQYEKDTIDDFGNDDEPDILIVVDKLLTGFDEPRNAVLYIDKPLEGHNLIQAVARVNRVHDAKRHGLLVDYRGILDKLDNAIRDYQDLAQRTLAGFDTADLDGLYANVATEYKRLPELHRKLWSFFKNVANKRDREQFRQVLTPRYATDEEGNDYDERQKLRDDFYVALTEFGMCLQTALSSRSFFEDESFPEAIITGYKRDLKFFAELRHEARLAALETVDYSAYEEQIRKLVDKQVIGSQVREPSGLYQVDKLGQSKDPETWSEEKARNEADVIRTRVRKTIEQGLADDPYAQKVFGELLRQAIAEAEAMFEHPIKQYALFKDVEEKLASGETPGIPEDFGDNRQARAYYGVLRLSVGNDAFDALPQEQRSHYVLLAKQIDGVVRDAVAENSLNPQSIEAAIRKQLLPTLFHALGLDGAREALEQVVQVVRTGMSRP